MSTQTATAGERRCALLMCTLHTRDRRRLLSQLPKTSAAAIERLVAQLERLPFDVASLASAVLEDELRDLSKRPPLGVNELVQLSRRLPSPWFARTLSACTGTDSAFLLALLDGPVAAQTRADLQDAPKLPAKLADAIRTEAASLLPPPRQAA